MDLCELDDLKTALAITDTSEDANLERLISATSDAFLMEIDRPDFAPEVDYTEYVRGNCVRRHTYWSSWPYHLAPAQHNYDLWLLHYPVNEITKITINGTEIVAVTDPGSADASGYWFDADAAPEDRQRIVLINQPYSYPFQVKAEYQGGYDEIPPDVSEAIIDWVSFRRGQEQVHRIVQTGGASISAGTVTVSSTGADTSTSEIDVPSGVQCVIERYKRVTF